MKRQTHIIAGIQIKPGDADALFQGMLDIAGTARLPRCERSLKRSIECAHGLVIEAAERVNQKPDEKSLRLLDAALTSYQRRVLLLCVNRKKRQTK